MKARTILSMNGMHSRLKLIAKFCTRWTVAGRQTRLHAIGWPPGQMQESGSFAIKVESMSFNQREAHTQSWWLEARTWRQSGQSVRN